MRRNKPDPQPDATWSRLATPILVLKLALLAYCVVTTAIAPAKAGDKPPPIVTEAPLEREKAPPPQDSKKFISKSPG